MGRLANKLKFEQEDKYILKFGQIHFATKQIGWCILWEGLPSRKQTKAVQNAWSNVYGDILQEFLVRDWTACEIDKDS